ncbi:MAG: DinB family protein [Planctomycetota bacterium]|jgi:hypothetical protein
MSQPPAGLEITNPTAYQQKLEALLGDRDPLAVLSETPEVIGRIAEEHTTAQLQARPFAGKWTPNEIIGHLTDAEWAYGWRIRCVLGQDGSVITGFDQDAWVTVQRFNDREPAQLVDMFRRLRHWNLGLWKQMTPSDLERVGKHDQRGPESLGLMLRMHAGHDLIHQDQITRYLDAIKAG